MFGFGLLGAQQTIVLKTATGELEGTITVPANSEKVPVILLIAGSGPTDRNCNNTAMETNSYKYLAEDLQKKGIAMVRYDKRGVGRSDMGVGSEADLRFEHYIEDARLWIEHLSHDRRFSKIIVAGHSEGGLIALAAAQKTNKIAGIVSIAAPGRPLDVILKEQLSGSPDNIKNIMYGMIDQLKQGDTIANVPPIYYALFRPEVQPFMISFFKYDPAQEMKKIKLPVLILQGSTDIQVKQQDAEILAANASNGELKMVSNMNHVLKYFENMDKKAQAEDYADTAKPLHPEVVGLIETFVKKIKDQ